MKSLINPWNKKSNLSFDLRDERVVAVFAQGPAWQFKNWPWGGNPVEIFQRSKSRTLFRSIKFNVALFRKFLVKAYHLKWSQLKADPNISKWSVQLIELDQNKRHLDCARLRTFWETLDQ